MTDASAPATLRPRPTDRAARTVLGRYHAAMRPTCELSVIAEGERDIGAVGEH